MKKICIIFLALLALPVFAVSADLERGGVCAVEWSEQVADAMPEDTVYVTIARCPEADHWRVITIEGVDIP